MFLIFRRFKAQNFLSFLPLKSKAIQVNAFWANLELEGGKLDFFLPFAYCSGRWNLSYIEILIKWFGPFKTSKICQAKLLSYFLRFFWVSLENFLVFFLFLLILQPNFLIKRFLIKKNECIWAALEAGIWYGSFIQLI